jgi:PadR family transcriptional regulator PadR
MKSANLHILEGTLYPLLTRLKNAELLSYRWVESNSGPPRKYFLMTEKGLAFYNELQKTWQELADAVQLLTQSSEPTNNHLNPENTSTNEEGN